MRRPRVGTMVAPLDLRDIDRLSRCAACWRAVRRPWRPATPTRPTRRRSWRAFEGAEAAMPRGDYRAMLAMDRAFHQAVAHATHNPMLARYLIVPAEHRHPLLDPRHGAADAVRSNWPTSRCIGRWARPSSPATRPPRKRPWRGWWESRPAPISRRGAPGMRTAGSAAAFSDGFGKRASRVRAQLRANPPRGISRRV